MNVLTQLLLYFRAFVILKILESNNFVYYIILQNKIIRQATELQAKIDTVKMLNVQMYTQMGYTEAQVHRAHEYSQKNKIDMFDALQQLQNKDYAEKQRKVPNNVPIFSYLNNIKNINLNEYEIIYSRYGIKQNSYAREQLRQINTPVGLFNVSNCCYLNSLLQCYFLMGSFTRQILAAEEIQQLPEQSGTKNKRIKNEYLLLGALKQMFSKMKLSSRRYLNPTPVLKNLVNSVGEKIQYGDQKDLHEINMEIVQRLSECLMFTKRYYSKGEQSPSKIKRKQNIKNLFYGQKVEFIEGAEGEIVTDFMGIIINPKHDNIISALDEQFNYDVEIDGKVMKRHTFIRTLPRYLFLTISRAQFIKKGNQLQKNFQKISFDFVLYLDQYLQTNKQEAKIKNPKIKQLQNRKSIIKSQLNHLNILGQKLEECKLHAKYLSGWEQRLPKVQQVETKRNSFKKQIQAIEHQLNQVESRKQKFSLMYLFVHRGDAISGHYWGYGRNGNNWYRFDVSCVPMKQSDILIDMQKSGGIPYALVYAKDDQIECFSYPYYTQLNTDLVSDLSTISKQDYADLIPQKLKKHIIEENKQMHQSILKQKNKMIVEDVMKDYKVKFNIVKSQYEKYSKDKAGHKIPLYCNFACYLESLKQEDFMKSNIFSIAILNKAEMTIAEILQNQTLLKTIQKAFKKKIKGKMNLRHFAIEFQPSEGSRYKKASQQYIVGKKCLQFIKTIYNHIKQWPKISILNALLDQISEVFKKSAEEGIFVKSIARELLAIILIDLVSRGEPIKLSWAQACQKQNPLLKSQLKALKMKQIPQKTSYEETPISKIELQTDWSLQSLKKGFENELFEGVRQIIGKLSDALSIYKTNTRENKIIEQTGSKQEPQPKMQVINEDLI